MNFNLLGRRLQPYALQHLLSSAENSFAIIASDIFDDNKYFYNFAGLILTPGPIVEVSVTLFKY